MSLEPRRLDDRTYQQLVDDARRHVQRRCPSWTDHNLSDPGITLIETFAYMVEQVIYRLNRVPDRNYVKFLELMGVRLRPPAAARTAVTFWLAGPRPAPVSVVAGTGVSTLRGPDGRSVNFQTDIGLDIVPTTLAAAFGAPATEGPARRFHIDERFACFSDVPRVGDALEVGLADAVPSCAVALELECEVAGLNIRPDQPPIRWEALTTEGWVECELDADRSDEVAGLNRSGRVVLHVPPDHVATERHEQRAGWLRCVVIETDAPDYSASPVITSIRAATVGGTVFAHHAEIISGEVLGVSDGSASQRFPLIHGPVVTDDGDGWVLEVEAGSDGSSWEEWTHVTTFADSGTDDPHFVIDAAAGEVELGPVVRLEDGARRRYGRRIPHGRRLRLRSYAVGGGQSGNVDAGQLTLMRTAVPFVASVTNRRPAQGGVDAETLDDAKRRGPLVLHSRDRAVTAEDFESITMEADRRVARVRCVAGEQPASVRVLVVPEVPKSRPVDRPALDIEPECRERILARLDERRLVGTFVRVEPPPYTLVRVDAMVTARLRADPVMLEAAIIAALERYLHPLVGGPGGRGWPFGRDVLAGELHGIVQAVRGVNLVDDVVIATVDPAGGAPPTPAVDGRIALPPSGLVVSDHHSVRVIQ